MKRIFHKIMGQIKVIRESADQCTSFHRDFLGAHRYTTEGGMCALRGPLHGAGCLTVSAIRGNNLSPSLRYPFMYFACQSFTGWKEMGRFVKKGEKGIKILAPAPYTIQREQNKLDDRGKPMMDKDGEPIMESVEIKVNAFKVVSTFDVSQTDGKELPSLGVDELTGGVDGYGTFFEALKEVCPVPITFENIEGGAKGFYSQTEKRIAIQEGMSEAQTVKTAIHEMAHQKLHAIENNGPKQSRNSKEVEAESVAYTVCQHYGIDTSDYSFSYVAGWSEGKETPELKASLDTIRRAASEMISAIDEKMEVLIQEKQKDMVLASDVTNLKGTDYQYSEGSREAEYTFSCEVKGEPAVLTYTLSHHDDGQLHGELLKYTAFEYDGKFKTTANEIAKTYPNGEQEVIFKPLEPYEIPDAVRSLCESYQKALENEVVDALILIPCFVLDFLCIHPFNDENGRMSRLLTLLLLYKSGYMVGQYISIEKAISDTKESYYEALAISDYGWREEKNDPKAFIKYMLGVILSCYREFESRVDVSNKIGPKSTSYDIVKYYVESKIGTFTKQEALTSCPQLGSSSVEAALKKLVANGVIVKMGAGRKTHYVRVEENNIKTDE